MPTSAELLANAEPKTTEGLDVGASASPNFDLLPPDQTGPTSSDLLSADASTLREAARGEFTPETAGPIRRTIGSAFAGIERSAIGRPLAKLLARVPGPGQEQFRQRVELAPYFQPEGTPEELGQFGGGLLADLPLFEAGGGIAGAGAKTAGLGKIMQRIIAAGGAGAAQGAGTEVSARLQDEAQPGRTVLGQATRGAAEFAPVGLLPGARTVPQIARNVLGESAIFGATATIADAIENDKPIDWHELATRTGGNILPFALLALIHAPGNLRREKVRQSLVDAAGRDTVLPDGRKLANLDVDELTGVLSDKLRQQTGIKPEDAMAPETEADASATEKGLPGRALPVSPQVTTGLARAEDELRRADAKGGPVEVPGEQGNFTDANDPAVLDLLHQSLTGSGLSEQEAGRRVVQLPPHDRLRIANDWQSLRDFTLQNGKAAQPAAPAKSAEDAAVEVLQRRQRPEGTVPEQSKTLQEQFAATLAGRRRATFVPDVSLHKVNPPDGLEAITLEQTGTQEGGVVFYKPQDAAAVRNTIAMGRLPELLGYIEPKENFQAAAPKDRVTVEARDPQGNELWTALATTTSRDATIESARRQFPEANIFVNGAAFKEGGPANGRETVEQQKEKGLPAATPEPLATTSGEAANPQSTAPSPRQFRQKYSPDSFGDDPVVAGVIDAGGLMSRSTAQRQGRYDANKSLWDDAPTKWEHASHNKVYKAGGGLMPDEMANILFSNGLLKENSVTELWQALERSSKGARAALASERRMREAGKEADATAKVEAKQSQAFSQDALKPTAEAYRVKATDLQVGSSVTVDGEKLTVTGIDPDTFDVTLTDGKKYGVQTVTDNEILYVEHVDRKETASAQPATHVAATADKALELMAKGFEQVGGESAVAALRRGDKDVVWLPTGKAIPKDVTATEFVVTPTERGIFITKRDGPVSEQDVLSAVANGKIRQLLGQPEVREDLPASKYGELRRMERLAADKSQAAEERRQAGVRADELRVELAGKGGGQATGRERLARLRSHIDAEKIKAYVDGQEIKPEQQEQAVNDISTGITQIEQASAEPGAGSYADDLFGHADRISAKVRAKKPIEARERRLQREADALRGDPAALREVLNSQRRASSIIPELVSREMPRWDITGTVINNPGDFFAATWAVRNPYLESFKVAVLSDDNVVVHSRVISVGSLNASIVEPRETMRVLQEIRDKTGKNYKRLIMGHNHPSGDPTPSSEDISITKRLTKAANELGFEVLDHVITDGDKYVSLKELGLHSDTSITAGKTSNAPKSLQRVTREKPPEQAPWEVVKRSELKSVSDPGAVNEIAKGLRTDDPDSAHIFYLTTKNALTGIERVSALSKGGERSLLLKIVEGAAREGAAGVIVDVPGGVNSENTQLVKALAKKLDIFNIPLLDALTLQPDSKQGFASWKELGLLETPGEYKAKPREALNLESPTPEQLKAENAAALAKQQRADMEASAAEPLKGTAGDLGQKDMFEPNDLFVRETEAHYNARQSTGGDMPLATAETARLERGEKKSKDAERVPGRMAQAFGGLSTVDLLRRGGGVVKQLGNAIVKFRDMTGERFGAGLAPVRQVVADIGGGDTKKAATELEPYLEARDIKSWATGALAGEDRRMGAMQSALEVQMRMGGDADKAKARAELETLTGDSVKRKEWLQNKLTEATATEADLRGKLSEGAKRLLDAWDNGVAPYYAGTAEKIGLQTYDPRKPREVLSEPVQRLLAGVDDPAIDKAIGEASDHFARLELGDSLRRRVESLKKYRTRVNLQASEELNQSRDASERQDIMEKRRNEQARIDAMIAGAEAARKNFDALAPARTELSDAGKRLTENLSLDEWRKGLKIKTGELGAWRQFKRIGKDYWPRVVQAEVMRDLKDEKGAAYTERVKQAAAWWQVDETKARELLRREQGTLFAADDFFSNLEMARTTSLPTDWYDHRYFTVVPVYAEGASKRLSQVEAFGQVTKYKGSGPRRDWSGQLFQDAYDASRGDPNAAGVIKAAHDSVYNLESKDWWWEISRFGRTFQVATKMGLNWWTALRNLSTLGTNTMPEFGAVATAKGLFTSLFDWRETLHGLKDAGVVRDDLLGSFADATDFSALQSRLISKALKFGGFTFTENLNRTTSALAGRLWAASAVREIDSDPNSRGAKLALAKFNKLDVDWKTLRDEFASRGDQPGPETRKLMRNASAETQFTYDERQLPVWGNKPLAKLMFQFQNFSLQMQRRMYNDVFRAAIVGEKVNGERVRDWWRALLTVGAMAGVGEVLLTGVRAALFDKRRKDASIDEIARTADADTWRAMRLALVRLFNDGWYSGALGAAAEQVQNASTLATRFKGKNPLEPPALGTVRNSIEGLLIRYTQQGKLTADDLKRWLANELPASSYAETASKKLSREIGEPLPGANLQEIRADVGQLRALRDRFLNERGLERMATGGAADRSPSSPLFDRLSNALLEGDAKTAIALKREYLSAARNLEDQQRRLAALRGVVNARRPITFGGLEMGESAGRNLPDEFSTWLRERDPGMAGKLTVIERRYAEAAHAANLAVAPGVAALRQGVKGYERGPAALVKDITVQRAARSTGKSEADIAGVYERLQMARGLADPNAADEKVQRLVERLSSEEPPADFSAKYADANRASQAWSAQVLAAAPLLLRTQDGLKLDVSLALADTSLPESERRARALKLLRLALVEKLSAAGRLSGLKRAISQSPNLREIAAEAGRR